MKNLFFLLAILGCAPTLYAQTWRAEVQSITGNSKVKTLKIRPEMRVNISKIWIDNDSLKESTNYDGYFLGGTRDSVYLRLKEVKTSSILTNGTRKQTIVPGKYYLKVPARDSAFISLALKQMDFLSYQDDKRSGYAEIGEPLILGSILVMILSPFICYNYKDGSFNTKRYKYWALGSTAGLTVGFAIPMTFATVYKQRKFQFKTGWPSKDAWVWKFE